MDRRHFLHHASATAAAFGALRYLGACRPAAGNAASPFARVRDQYFLRSLELYPTTATYLGGDGYDPSLRRINGRLRDYRAPAIDAEVNGWRMFERDLRRIDRAALAEAERIDYDVMQAQLGFLIHQLADRHYHERAVDTYVAEPFRGVDWQIQQMTAQPNGLLGTEDEWRLVIERVGNVPAFLDAARANLADGKRRGNLPDRRMVQRDGIQGSDANATYFRVTLGESAKKYLGDLRFAPSILGQLGRVGEAAAAAYQRFGQFLGDTFDLRETTDRYAVGDEEYNWRVQHCLRVSRRTPELYQYGLDQVAHFEERLFGVAAEVAREAQLPAQFGTEAERRAGVRAVVEYLSHEAPRDDDELLRWYRETGERAVAYGREHTLFDVPAEYRLDVVPTPPVLRSTIDAAYYPAPPFKKSGVGRFYLTPTGNDPAALRQNNRASVADTAVHEGFPGHDWHYKYMTQHAGEIANIRWLTPGAVEDSSSMWEDSMAAEGWALYSEELMSEPVPGRPHGFYSAAEHLYELQGQLMRAARVRVDVGIHTGRMSFDEAVDYFAEHVLFQPEARRRAATEPAARAATDTAQRAIYRYSKWPTQAITYNLGMNEILALRDVVRAKAGPSFAPQAFHERLMRMGTIPAGYFRDTFVA